MSDIGLNLDGVVALLAAGALCLLLLVALAVCSLFVWAGHRRTAFPHLVGILCSLAGAVAVLATVLVTLVQSDGNLEPNRAGARLDGSVLLWAPAVLALWPIGMLLYRRRQRSADTGR
jgi:hypothetical protein